MTTPVAQKMCSTWDPVLRKFQAAPICWHLGIVCSGRLAEVQPDLCVEPCFSPCSLGQTTTTLHHNRS